MIPTVSIVLILSIPSLITVGMDQIYPLLNPANMQVADVLDTYVLRTAFNRGISEWLQQSVSCHPLSVLF